jgi:hypothetical protein
VDLRQVWSLHRGQTTDTFVNAQTLVHDRTHMSFSIIMRYVPFRRRIIPAKSGLFPKKEMPVHELDSYFFGVRLQQPIMHLFNSDMTVDVVADSPLQFELWTQGLIMFIKRAKSYWNASTTRYGDCA